MKRFYTFIFLSILMFSANVQAEIISGGISYDANSAREELLDGISYTTDSTYINNAFYDKDYEQNSAYILKGITSLKDRKLAYFSDGSYAVLNYSDMKHVYYYASNGILMYIENRSGNSYPYKCYKYNTQKKLVNMSLRVSESETFIYNPAGELVAHWVKDKAYDKDGNVIMKRKYVE